MYISNYSRILNINKHTHSFQYRFKTFKVVDLKHPNFKFYLGGKNWYPMNWFHESNPGHLLNNVYKLFLKFHTNNNKTIQTFFFLIIPSKGNKPFKKLWNNRYFIS